MNIPDRGCWLIPNDPGQWVCGSTVTSLNGATFVVVDTKQHDDGRIMYLLLPEADAKEVLA
jgi:hypothetical protein